MRKKPRPHQLRGLAVSPGIGIGTVQLIESIAPDVPQFRISDRQVPIEITRLQEAIRKTRRELSRIKDRLCRFQVGDQIRIIESHQMLASDATLLQDTLHRIRQEKINAEWAFDQSIQKLKSSLPSGHDDYFRERFEELTHVAHRILQNLIGLNPVGLPKFRRDGIVVARELSPADAAQMLKGVVQGFLMESGGPTSHTVIVAKALEIPAVVGIDGITHRVRDGDPILIDGYEGIVLIHPTQKELTRYRAIQKKGHRIDRLLLKEVHLPPVTQDGYRLRLAANMELIDEIPTIKSHGAEGIGLFRTEMLFATHNRFLNEEEQFETYKQILGAISPHPTVIRTLDIGGDTLGPDRDGATEGLNPALGLRAIRYCLKERDLLKTQLRAMIRASFHGPLKLLIPMVTNLDEIRLVKKMITEIQGEFRSRKVPFDPDMKVGAMVEIPSIAIMADEVCRETDFLSIGTNDLIQYTLAVDRDNEEVSHLYEPLHPAILRLLKMVCDAAKARKIEVSVCGEMAGNPVCFLILLGLGLNELSMNPVSIPRVKKLTRAVTFRQAKDLLDRALTCRTASEVEHLIKKETAKIDGFPKF